MKLTYELYNAIPKRTENIRRINERKGLHKYLIL